MKNTTVKVQIQFDTFSKDIKEEVIKTLENMNTVLGERFSDISPVIFTNAIDDSDIEANAFEDEEININEGVETKFGEITMNHAMFDIDGTNLEGGLEIKLDGELIGEAIGFTSDTEFDNIEEVEAFVEEHCEDF